MPDRMSNSNNDIEQYPVEGFFETPRPILMSLASLDSHFPITVGGRNAVLITPRTHRNTEGRPVLDSPTWSIPSSLFCSDTEWGHALSWHATNTTVGVVSVLAFGIAFQSSEDASAVLACTDGPSFLQTWWGGVLAWLSAIGQLPINPISTLSKATSHKGVFWHSVSSTLFEYPGRMTMSMCMSDLLGIPSADFQIVLDSASIEERLPLELVLMGNAVEASGHKEWRTAIIDASTSVELVLRKLILKVDPSLSGNHHFENKSTLGCLYQKATGLGCTIDSGIGSDLLPLRNDVVHRGRIPNQQEGQRALKAALNLIRSYSYVPDLQSRLFPNQ